MSKSFTDLNATELNEAIDDTNFPRILNNKNISTHCNYENSSSDKDKNLEKMNHTNGEGSTSSTVENHRPTPLKIVSFNESLLDYPGTPRTPRTSTTPGNLINNLFKVIHITCVNVYSKSLQFNTLQNILIGWNNTTLHLLERLYLLVQYIQNISQDERIRSPAFIV